MNRTLATLAVMLAVAGPVSAQTTPQTNATDPNAVNSTMNSNHTNPNDMNSMDNGTNTNTRNLPRTASPLPLVAGAGVLTIATGLWLDRRRRQL